LYYCLLAILLAFRGQSVLKIFDFINAVT